jgi:hemerythrin-like domain-containing protein
MTPTDTLKHEHQVLLLVLDAAEKETRVIRASGKVRVDRLGQMIDFFRMFVDRCHHGKEEKHLFPLMKKRCAAKADGPIKILLKEHKEGRAMIKDMARSLRKAAKGDGRAAANLAQDLVAYGRLLRNHTDKEDDVVYPMADEVLIRIDQQALTRAFDRVEAKEMGEGVHEEYHRLAHDLAKG